jgi:drug/metabolite transporter (DMT)-like permease
MSIPAQSKLRAAVLIMVAVGFATTQDAIVKAMSGTYPAYETVAFRGLAAVPFISGWALWEGHFKDFITPDWPRVLVRSIILFSAYLAFVLSIATLPLANAVAIYFTMPFFLCALSGWFLSEPVPPYRWAAICVGFVGVLISVRPGRETFQPASLLALYAAFGYAIGQLLGRQISRTTAPVNIANFQNIFYLLGSVAIGLLIHFTGYSASAGTTFASLARPFAIPTFSDATVMTTMGLFSAISSIVFVKAYQAAPANFVAPFEYSSMVWALLFGIFVFKDFPDQFTLVGAAIVISAGLFLAWRDRAPHTTG